MWRKLKKKRNVFSFWNGIDLSSRGIISTLCCYAGGGQLLLEFQAKGDKGDPWIGVCVEGVGGGRGPSQAKRFSHVQTCNPIHSELSLG